MTARIAVVEGGGEFDVRALPVMCGLLMVALAAGCTSDPETPAWEPGASAAASTAASPPAWTEPANYEYVVERGCEGKKQLGIYKVTVAGGEVANVERTDDRQFTSEEEIEPPTLGGLLEIARTAAEDGGKMSTSADPADGHPVAVSFDVSENGDNEDNTCFVISEYTPRS
ncbi:DUF6174 domain-containing protein [Actinoplanes sp. NPDC051494]|uniref:DUF6174 domain-containing protein n=1 Tax=Actinoplanes sp. NPDC051494 TaxID=3363907 RepID=UPI0037B6194F